MVLSDFSRNKMRIDRNKNRTNEWNHFGCRIRLTMLPSSDVISMSSVCLMMFHCSRMEIDWNENFEIFIKRHKTNWKYDLRQVGFDHKSANSIDASHEWMLSQMTHFSNFRSIHNHPQTHAFTFCNDRSIFRILRVTCASVSVPVCWFQFSNGNFRHHRCHRHQYIAIESMMTRRFHHMATLSVKCQLNEPHFVSVRMRYRFGRSTSIRIR